MNCPVCDGILDLHPVSGVLFVLNEDAMVLSLWKRIRGIVRPKSIGVKGHVSHCKACGWLKINSDTFEVVTPAQTGTFPSRLEM